MAALVGRETELGLLLAALESEGPSATVLTAAPGLGKTALMEAFLELARERDLQVLTARPLESEWPLAFSTLTDLFATVSEEQYDDLPVPQRNAIRAALLLDEAEGSVDPRAVSAGVGGVLASLTQLGKVLLALDDAHWMDSGTAVALARSLRRLEHAPLVLVVASRPTGRQASEWLPAYPSRTLELGAMSARELAGVVRDRLGVELDPGAQRTMHRLSGGNPLFAVEFARHRTGEAATTFAQLLASRLRALPRSTRLAVLGAALAGTPTPAVVAAARGISEQHLMEHLEPAVADELVTVTDRVEFVHPLYAEAVIAQSAQPDVNAARARLAEVDDTEEARARHLAAVRIEPDDELANRLDADATAARRRGGWESAIELLRLAIDRTPDAGTAAGRALLLGEWLLAGGQVDEAIRVLERARQLGEADRGPTFWRCTIRLAETLLLGMRLDDARPLLDELRAADLEPVLRAESLICAEVDAVDRALALPMLDRANALLADVAEEPQVAELAARGLTYALRLRQEACQPFEHLVGRALELERLAPPRQLMDSIELSLAHELVHQSRHDEARQRYLDLLERAEARGDDVSVPLLISQLSHCEYRAGDWTAWRERAREAHEAAAAQGHVYAVLTAIGLGVAETLTGSDLEGGLRRLEAAVEAITADPSLTSFAAIAWHQRGVLLGLLGRWDEACEAQVAADRCRREGDWLDPGDLVMDLNLVEALVATHQLDEAEKALDDLEERIARAGRDYLVADARLGRLMVAAARGDLEDVVADLPAVLALFEPPTYNEALHRGHALLFAGRVFRRAKQKRQAHQVLTAALELARDLDCPSMLGLAQGELARVGLRPSAPATLTDSERRVAELAASGLTNSEVAAAAFISVKTVEATLGRAYRKLGISRRAELARMLDAPAEG